MKNFPFIILYFVIGCININPSTAQSKKQFFSIGEDKHYTEEFIYAYSKNNQKENAKKDSIDSYLDLYINFRLKVKEAKSLGYDTTSEFKSEFKLYKSQLEESYLSPKKEQEALTQEAYDRSLKEVRASHLLILVSEDAKPIDTLKAYTKVVELRKRFLNGEDFNNLSKTYSEDPSAKQNGGDLGYFSVFQMVYPFETAAYTTNIGEVSNPIRTKFGFHLIKVEDKRKNDGKIQVAHIMIRSTSKNGEQLVKIAEQKAYKADSLLKTGTSWGEVCKNFSEDQNSVNQDGVLKPFGRGQIVPEFEQAAFKLKDINEISKPIKSPYGWHIIKLIKKIPVGSFEQEKSNLVRKIKSDNRSSMPKNEMLRVLKLENNFSRNDSAIASLLQLPPSVIINNKWGFDSLRLADSSVLFSIGNEIVTTGTFLSSFNNELFRSGFSQEEMKKRLLNFEDSLVISYEKAQLPKKYPEYSFLINEYYDGILLFSIMEDSVWNYSMKDSTGLKSFYDNNKGNYISLVKDTVVFRSDSVTLNNIAQDSPKKLSRVDWKMLNSKLLEENNVSPLTLHVVSKSDEMWVKIFSSIDTDKSAPFEIDNEWYWIRIGNVINQTPLKDIKGKVISDYQSFLDRKWIEKLRKKYPVKISKKQLNKVYTNFGATD